MAITIPVVSWRVGAHNKLDFHGPLNTLNDTYYTDATITVTVRNRAGVALAGLTNVAAPYVSGTGADTLYRMVAVDTVVPPLGLYKAEAIATRAGVTGREYATILVEEG